MHNFILANGDTDSIAFKKLDQKPFTLEEQDSLLREINSLMPEHIVWKHDKVFRRMIVCKAKNYILDDGKKIVVKGSGLKATKKEKALKNFINEVVELLLKDRKEYIFFLYLQYIKKIWELKEINDWCFKATITKAVLTSERTNEKKVRDAIQGTDYVEGDKVYLFFRSDESLCLKENYNNDINRERLLGKLNDTLKVFENIIDVDLFPNFTLARNKELLNEILHA